MSTRAELLVLMLLAGLAVLSPAGRSSRPSSGGRGRKLAPRRRVCPATHSARQAARCERSFLPFVGPSGFFGSSLVGSAPVGNGPSTLAVDPATHTIYVANGYNPNGRTR